MNSTEASLLTEIWTAAGGDPAVAAAVQFTGASSLESRYPVGSLASASVAAAGLAAAELAASSGPLPRVLVNRELASAWFGTTLQPDGWQPPAVWDALAGDYKSKDSWIRLHTNDPKHRAAVLSVLGIAPGDDVKTKAAVAERTLLWSADELEAAVYSRGGCAARLRTPEEWGRHPQGIAVAAEPLLISSQTDEWAGDDKYGTPAAPLMGLRVLDLTRVLAGPTATRFLAGLGAEVLRIDPLERDEPGIETEMTLGKRTARLDLKVDRNKFLELLAGADVLVHGYRPGALEGLGLGEQARRINRPGLVEAALDAYGWSGPWRERRGFDSLVQMSSGIALPDDGLNNGSNRPRPLPVQALDHATGYILATAVLRGLTNRRQTQRGSFTRASLARTALMLETTSSSFPGEESTSSDGATRDGGSELHEQSTPEQTGWGAARRLPGPVRIGNVPLGWQIAAAPLGGDTADWSAPR